MVAATAAKKKAPVAKKKAVVKKAAPVKFTPPETTEGTWEDTIVKSAVLKERAAKGDAKAGELLWSGAQQGITAWLPDSDEDASAEGLYSTLLALMGKARKGDASKIAKVAVAVKDKGLVLSSYTNLSKAYNAARELLDSAPEHLREDDAAEELTAAIGESAPKSTSSVDGAAKILLAAGVDAATQALVAAVIDAAGGYDKAEPVLRSFARSLSQEIVGKKPKPEPKPKAPAKPKGEAVAKATKAKPASEKAPTKAKPKPAPVEDVEDDEPVEDGTDEADLPEIAAETDDLYDEVEDEADDVEADEPEVEEAPVKKKPAPVVRRR